MYFHENQFAYPSSTQQHASIEPQMVNLYSALAADYVLFNSHYNRQTLLDGARVLLKKMPDFAPLEAIEKIRQRSNVLPVPIQPANISSDKKATPSQTLKVIWNHRWEYDKGPEVLQQVIRLNEKRGLDIQFTIAGRRFRSIPEPFKDLQNPPANCVIHMGTFEDRAQYLSALSQHHVVLSTAHHEFQGLAMLEGATYGCTPLAPNDLAYPEWIPPDCLYQTHSNVEAQANIILNHLSQWQTGSIPATPDTQSYIWPELAKQYSEKLLKIKEEYSV
jgi:glycosyltransferase involved in cell wall biosynthesis